MKFKKEKVSSLMGFTEVKFTQDPSEHGTHFQITADAGGIRIKGESAEFMTQEDLMSFGHAVTHAWDAHLELKHEIRESLVR